jgi:hypothetical protein
MDIECEAEGKVSAAEFSHLENNSRNAFENMMLFARGVILARPSTHRGLIHQARYLAAQFNDPIASASGCTYLPDKIGEQPWPQTYLRNLAAGLRKMAGELDDEPGKAAR